MPFAHLFKMCEGRTTKIARLGDNMPDRDTRSERLRVNMSEREARFRKGNQHVDNYMGNGYS